MSDPTYRLLLDLAGRVDDDLLATARELVAVGEEGHALQLLVAELVAGGVALPAALRPDLVAEAAARRVEPDADRHLPRAAGPEDGTPHRFTGAGEAGPLAAALAAVAPPDGGWAVCWRITPAGVAPGPLPHPVLLGRCSGEGSAEVLTYRAQSALQRAGIAASVEVRGDADPETPYHRAAGAVAVPLDAPDGRTGRHGTGPHPVVRPFSAAVGAVPDTARAPEPGPGPDSLRPGAGPDLVGRADPGPPPHPAVTGDGDGPVAAPVDDDRGAPGTDDPAGPGADTWAPTITDAPTPVTVDEPAPTGTDAPPPTVMDAPAPAIVDEPTPIGTDAPTPTVVDEPAPAGTDAPAPDRADGGAGADGGAARDTGPAGDLPSSTGAGPAPGAGTFDAAVPGTDDPRATQQTRRPRAAGPGPAPSPVAPLHPVPPTPPQPGPAVRGHGAAEPVVTADPPGPVHPAPRPSPPIRALRESTAGDWFGADGGQHDAAAPPSIGPPAVPAPDEHTWLEEWASGAWVGDVSLDAGGSPSAYGAEIDAPTPPPGVPIVRAPGVPPAGTGPHRPRHLLLTDGSDPDPSADDGAAHAAADGATGATGATDAPDVPVRPTPVPRPTPPEQDEPVRAGSLAEQLSPTEHDLLQRLHEELAARENGGEPTPRNGTVRPDRD